MSKESAEGEVGGLDACPLSETDDKVDEAHYFLHQALEAYHLPDQFRYRLNGFLQALRSVTLYLQAELAAVDGFTEWYEPHRERMKQDLLLRRFLEGRNVVAHRRSLESASHVEAGVFQYRGTGWITKLALSIPIPPRRSSASVLEVLQKESLWMDPEHSAIGEQLGVRRRWAVPELDSDEEVMTVCHIAWSRIQRVTAEAHALVGRKRSPVPEEPIEIHDYRSYNLLLESDLDPDAFERWGWQ